MKKIHISRPRSAALLALGWLHWSLLLAITFAAFFDMLYGLAELEIMSPQAAFFRGLLFAVPTGLSWAAVKRLRTLWQFFLASVGLCGLSWLLVGHPGGAVIMLVMCLIRARARMAEEEDGPVRSLFDTPSYFGLCAFVVLFLFSAMVSDGLPRLQWLCILGGALYIVVCMSYKGLERLDSYLNLNRDMYDLPARRIQRIAGSALLAGVLLTAVLLIPMALSTSGFVRITMPEFSSGTGQVEFEAEQDNGGGPAMMDLSGLIDEESQWQIPPIVGQILMVLTGGGLLIGMVLAVIQLFKDFRRSYTDSRDVVQYLNRDEREHAGETVERLKKPRLWDRSVNATVRRKYRRALLKAPEPPQDWMTPSEAESAAGADIPALHMLYEKARYSSGGCTQDDLKKLR